MKNILIASLIILVSLFSCGQQADSGEKKPLTSIEDAKAYAKANFKADEETIWIADEILDEEGKNIALIGVSIMTLDYIPSGHEQKDGYRIYKWTKKK